MQTSRHKLRHRGYRESSPLVQLSDSGPCDFYRISTLDTANSLEMETTSDLVAQLTEEQVAQLQSLRSQIRYRSRINQLNS